MLRPVGRRPRQQRRRPGRPRVHQWIDRFFEAFSEYASFAVLEVQRRACESIIGRLERSPEFLNLNEASGASAADVRQRVLADQESIFDEVDDGLAFLTALAAAVGIALAATLAAVLAGPTLWAAGKILVTAALAESDSVSAHLRWADAVAASGLPVGDIIIVTLCASVIVILIAWPLPGRTRNLVQDAQAGRADLTNVLMRRMRAAYHDATNASAQQPLRLRTAPGLANPGADSLLSRAELGRVRALAFDLGAGAIAVSGARGVGKTTLLGMLGQDELSTTDALVINVSAPVRYDAREFLLHLYGELARSVLGAVAMPLRRAWILRLRAAGRTIASTLIWAASFISIFYALVPELTGWVRETAGARSPTPASALVLWMTLRLINRRIGAPRTVQDGRFAAFARGELERARFLQTWTIERQSAFARNGLQYGRRRSRQIAEQPMTLPELVSRYRSFATTVAEWWRESHPDGKLLVGIDEVDRIVEAELAERFLNEVKSIFGVKHCVYVVSVSEEALANFERRVLLVRTVFDSAFDEIVRLRPLSADESVELLRRRLSGIPDGFHLLCHCLAGGMPRDVIRAARTMLDLHRQRTGPSQLAGIAQALVDREVSAITRGFLTPLDGSAIGAAFVTMSLGRNGWPGSTPAALAVAVNELVGVGPEWDKEVRPEVSLAAALYFYLTVLEIFTDRSDIIESWTSLVARSEALPGTVEPRLRAVAESVYAEELIRILEIPDELVPAPRPDLDGSDLGILGQVHQNLSIHPAVSLTILAGLRARLGLHQAGAGRFA